SNETLGRAVHTPGIEQAATFIAAEFKKACMQTIDGAASCRQAFAMVIPTFKSVKAILNGKALDEKNVIVITSQPNIKATQKDGYMQVRIKDGSNLFREASNYVSAKKNMLVMVDESFASSFNRLTGFKRQ